ncbi:MAG: FeoA domain-containing protein [Bacteroidetes bacterium]|nr:FeoA domain-containing protein [Bacteroidota bacterium]
MIDPAKALMLFGIIAAVAALFFLPKIGLVARWKRARRGMQRVLIEDALKHIFDCEYKNIHCTTESIAGTLLIPTDQAAELLTRLAVMGLLSTGDNGVHLTADGRSYALRVIRVHRLWERYLADETSVPATEWHASAELAEHTLTAAQTEALAAQIGNPHFDPHGDPIPTTSGEIPPKVGRSLLSLHSGEFAVVTHIEDEPETVFAQLTAQGLHVGMQVMMIERNNDRVRFAANGEEIVLAPLLANNLTVAPMTEEEQRITAPLSPLTTLSVGQEAHVLSISKAMRGHQRRRLMDLGVVPGTMIRAEMTSASGDPTAYSIRGALVALRRQHAEMIYIKKD